MAKNSDDHLVPRMLVNMVNSAFGVISPTELPKTEMMDIATKFLLSDNKAARDGSLAMTAAMHLVHSPQFSTGKMQNKVIAKLKEQGDGLSLVVAASIAESRGDHKQQAKLLKYAMAKGSPFAGMQLGKYHLSRGARSKALECYRHSAELGNPMAQHKMGYLMENIDVREAAK